MIQAVGAVANSAVAICTYSGFAASDFCVPTNLDLLFYLVAYLNIVGTRHFLNGNTNLSF